MARRKKKILLIISGSVAAYKALDLIRLLKKQDIEVNTILTKSGAEFITPLAISSLSGTKTYQDLFSLNDELEMGHIRLSREADLVVVAPASADMIAKMTHGIADSMALATLLASDTPLMVAPAMNHKMWSNPATQRNIQQLTEDGAILIEPETGSLACGEQGKGRMAAPEIILPAILQQLAQHKGPLTGKRAIVTSGPTHELIDPVRFIGNRSSGKQGYAIAEALEKAGAQVTLISGPTALQEPDGVKRIDVYTAEEMYQAVLSALPADISVFAAAVADWRPDIRAEQKIKKSQLSGNTPEISLVETTDILEAVGTHATKRPELVVGFAAETENVLKNASEKLHRKGCNWLMANDTSGGRIFGEDKTELLFIHKDGHEKWGRMEKTEAANQLADKIIDYYASSTSKRPTNDPLDSQQRAVRAVK